MRDLFLLDPGVTFLNHGSYGACPRDVLAAQHAWQLEMERNPVEFLGRRSGALLAAARTRLGALVGADAADLAWVPNSTTAVNIVARSLDLRPGDEVLATDHEYGACDATWQRICAARGATYRRVTIPLPFDRSGFAARVFGEIGPRTRLVFASHVTSTTAITFPVAELCAGARAAGVLTLIDGAHAPGQMDLDVAAIGADFYAGNCHKWLCAPKGSAFLFVRPEHQQRIEAPVISWGYVAGDGGHTGFDAYTGSTTMERRLQWQGTRDPSAFLTVPAAIDFQQHHDWPAVRRRCHALAAETLEVLSERFGLAPIAGDADWAQMVAIPVPHDDAERLRARLFDESRIEVPVTTHAGRCFVRVSVQGYNTAADLQRLLDAPALRR